MNFLKIALCALFLSSQANLAAITADEVAGKIKALETAQASETLTREAVDQVEQNLAELYATTNDSQRHQELETRFNSIKDKLSLPVSTSIQSANSPTGDKTSLDDDNYMISDSETKQVEGNSSSTQTPTAGSTGQSEEIDEESTDTDVGAIIGASIGGIAGLGTLALGANALRKRRAKNQTKKLGLAVESADAELRKLKRKKTPNSVDIKGAQKKLDTAIKAQTKNTGVLSRFKTRILGTPEEQEETKKAKAATKRSKAIDKALKASAKLKAKLADKKLTKELIADQQRVIADITTKPSPKTIAQTSEAPAPSKVNQTVEPATTSTKTTLQRGSTTDPKGDNQASDKLNKALKKPIVDTTPTSRSLQVLQKAAKAAGTVVDLTVAGKNLEKQKSPTAQQEALKTLGLKPGATAEEIRKAFKKLALKAHPDKGGTTKNFIAVKEAYEKLSKTQATIPPQTDTPAKPTGSVKKPQIPRLNLQDLNNQVPTTVAKPTLRQLATTTAQSTSQSTSRPSSLPVLPPSTSTIPTTQTELERAATSASGASLKETTNQLTSRSKFSRVSPRPQRQLPPLALAPRLPLNRATGNTSPLPWEKKPLSSKKPGRPKTARTPSNKFKVSSRKR